MSPLWTNYLNKLELEHSLDFEHLLRPSTDQVLPNPGTTVVSLPCRERLNQYKNSICSFYNKSEPNKTVNGEFLVKAVT